MTKPPKLAAALKEIEHGGVHHLDLSRCGLSEVPREVYDAADTLEILDLSGNALTALPDDFSRFRRLRALFCSGNRFERLPPVLGDCPTLSQIGFRGVGLREVPAEALPPHTRWLTLTDNRIESLPDTLGHRPELQKLMLSGNRLRALPDSLANAGRLELLRLSANAFDVLPGWLVDLPSLAWLAWAANPLDRREAVQAPDIGWDLLDLGPLLGEGASGRIHEAAWRQAAGSASRPVAVKLFKGAMTSDGLPEQEMAACLAAGEHPRLTGALGRVTGHPDQVPGLVMPLLPGDWRILAGPPSLQSCSRDVYDPALRLETGVAVEIARSVGEALAHLHGCGLSHGDVYAHNTLWDGCRGEAVLSDFGAAAFLPDAPDPGRLQRLEVLAWGRLLGELLDRCDAPSPALLRLQQACTAPEVAGRPAMAEVLDALDRA